MRRAGAASPMAPEGICEDTMLKEDDELLTAVMEQCACRFGLLVSRLAWVLLIDAAGALVIAVFSRPSCTGGNRG